MVDFGALYTKPRLFSAGVFIYLALMIRTPGRSRERILARNSKLAARYYFYSTIAGLKLSRCLEILQAEFDLSESRICDLIGDISDQIKAHERSGTTVPELRDLFPFLVWSYKV